MAVYGDGSRITTTDSDEESSTFTADEIAFVERALGAAGNGEDPTAQIIAGILIKLHGGRGRSETPAILDLKDQEIGDPATDAQRDAVRKAENARRDERNPQPEASKINASPVPPRLEDWPGPASQSERRSRPRDE